MVDENLARNLAERLSTSEILQDANGDDVYSALKVQLGYIQAHHTLHLPKSLTDAWLAADKSYAKIADIEQLTTADYSNRVNVESYLSANPYQMGIISSVTPDGDVTYHENLDAATLDILKVIALNYLVMSSNADSINSAAVIAKLRGRFVELGLANVMMQDNETDVGRREYVIVDENHEDDRFKAINAATTFLEFTTALDDKAQEIVLNVIMNDELTTWVTKYADHIISATEYVFRTRGHHFKTTNEEQDSYIKLYTRYFEASFPGESFSIPDATFFDIFHSAIHPFKIRSLVVMTHHFAMHRTLAPASLLRFSGAPTGNAMITTTVAALGNLAGESWYPKFMAIYSGQINMLKTARDAICAQRYSYHQAAGLYGVSKKDSVKIGDVTMQLEEVKATCSSIAAACQGYINILKELVESRQITGFALSNAKALEKAAAQSPLMALKISALVGTSIEIITNTNDVKTAAEQFLIDSKEATSSSKDES